MAWALHVTLSYVITEDTVITISGISGPGTRPHTAPAAASIADQEEVPARAGIHWFHANLSPSNDRNFELLDPSATFTPPSAPPRVIPREEKRF